MVSEQQTKKDKLMVLSQCLGSPQLEEIAKELGDDFQVFHSLLKNVEWLDLPCCDDELSDDQLSSGVTRPTSG